MTLSAFHQVCHHVPAPSGCSWDLRSARVQLMFCSTGISAIPGWRLGLCLWFCFSLCQLVHMTQGDLFTLSPGWKVDIKIFLSILWMNLSSFFLLLSLKWKYLEFFPGLSFYFYKMTKCLVLWCMFGRCVLVCLFFPFSVAKCDLIVILWVMG